jgi:hypothetical protein
LHFLGSKESSFMKVASFARIAGSAIMVVAALVAIANGFNYFKRHRDVDSVQDTQKLARTLEIIRTSTAAHPQVLKVLFYGQSITRSGWDQEVIAHWRSIYPHTVFVVENRALGGFASQDLVRTAEQDVAAFYPDLIVFHVYGDHHAYEQILRVFRSRTAADILLQTDHGDRMPEPVCPEGPRTTWSRPAGCTGILWLKQSEWHDEMSYHLIPGFGKKYGLAVEPQRAWWRDYLLGTHTAAEALLKDDVHPNERGKALIAAFFNRYFDGLVSAWSGQTEATVAVIPWSQAEQGNGLVTVRFNGSRLELLTAKPLGSPPSASIDGTSAGDLDGCYLVSRTSSTAGVPDWPALRRISLNHDQVEEDWVATLSNFSADEAHFQFRVRATKEGDEGVGDADHPFTSKSGSLHFEPQDWMFARALREQHVAEPSPFDVRWSVRNLCAGQPESIDIGNGSMQYRYVLAAGLDNGPHTVVLRVMPDELSTTDEFRAYKPPLRVR